MSKNSQVPRISPLGCRVAGGFGSSRSVEIFDRVFPGISFTLGYFRVFRVIRVFRVFQVFSLFFGANVTNEGWLSFIYSELNKICLNADFALF